MFTGIIQGVGTVRSLQGGVLSVAAPTSMPLDDCQLGESIAVNGVCLTVTSWEQRVLTFDLSEETLERTALSRIGTDSSVNLERAMTAADRFGGHVVQGHVDATGKLVSIRDEQLSKVYRFAIPQEGDKYLIDKGSIALDGISLTVVEPQKGEFDVWVIPHTIAQTNLGTLNPGDPVNVEYDVMAKHIEKLIASRVSS